jgi:serine/threonine protein kinase
VESPRSYHACGDTGGQFDIQVNALTEPSVQQPRQRGGQIAVQETTADAACNALSVLDQYYRRGILKPEQFRSLKAHFTGRVLGTAEDTEELIAPHLPIAVQAAIASAHGPDPADVAGSPTTAASANASRGTAEPLVPATVQEPEQSSERTLVVGDLLRGRYRLEAVIGQGGMGTVFQAVDQQLSDLPMDLQRVAVKVLHPQITRRPHLLAKLRREFQHLLSLSHPNIVRVHEFDRDGDLSFFTMEFLQGAPLSRLLTVRNGRVVNRSHALAIIREIGAALMHAHSRGIVHGDIKPHNIFITDGGEVRVLDFGASTVASRFHDVLEGDSVQDVPVATPAFASCQVLAGQAPEPSDDLYSFACVAYMLLAGQHPFHRFVASEARKRRMNPRRPKGLSQVQWRALRAGLAWERTQRPAELRKWLDQLGVRAAAQYLPPMPALMASPPPRLGPTNRTLLIATAALLLVGGAWMSIDKQPLAEQMSMSRARVAPVLAGAGALFTRFWDEARGSIGTADSADTKSTRASAPSNAVTPSTPVAGTAPETAPSPDIMPAVPDAALIRPAPTGSTAPAEIELADDTVDVSTLEPLARVAVHRKGNLRGKVRFMWWTESGTAKAGDDFAAYGASEEQIEEGHDAVTLLIPIVTDSTRRTPKNFFVEIGSPGAGVSLSGRTRAMVIIPPASQLQ